MKNKSITHQSAGQAALVPAASARGYGEDLVSEGIKWRRGATLSPHLYLDPRDRELFPWCDAARQAVSGALEVVDAPLVAWPSGFGSSRIVRCVLV